MVVLGARDLGEEIGDREIRHDVKTKEYKTTHKNHLDYANVKNIGHNVKVFPSIIELQVAFSLEVRFSR